MTRIVLVRHGHVEGIEPERFRGRMDVALSGLGLRQASATGRRIAEGWRVSEVYSSPLGRCLETARAIAAPTGGRVVPLEDLNDLDYGRWQWRTFDEMRSSAPALFQQWLDAPDLVRFPGGESLEDLLARTADALRAVCERSRGLTAVMVGHDSVNRMILLQLLGMPLSGYWRLVQSPCGINEIEIEGARIRVLRVNETAHLEGLRP